MFHFPARLFHHFLDLGRVDSAVCDQLFQCDTCHFPADVIETGKRNCLRCIVDDNVYTGQCFQCPDVSALSADDATLHFVVGQRHNRNRRLGHLVCGTLCDGEGDIAPCLFFALVLDLLLIVGDLDCLFVYQFAVQGVENVLFRLILCQTGDTLQFLQLAFLDFFCLCQLAVCILQPLLEGLFFPIQVVGLFVQILFLLLDAAFLPSDLRASVLDFFFRLRAEFIDLIFCFHHGILALCLCLFFGIFQNASGFFFGGTDGCFCLLFPLFGAVGYALAVRQKSGDRRTDQQSDQTQHGYQRPIHLLHLSALPPYADLQGASS